MVSFSCAAWRYDLFLILSVSAEGIRKIILGKRYEAFSMHHMLQGFAVDDLLWLHALPVQPQGRTCHSDHLKRRQLTEELIFWFYDGFLMPLIRVRTSVAGYVANSLYPLMLTLV